MIGREVTERENKEAEHDGDTDFEFRKSIKVGHFVFERYDGIVGDAIKEEGHSHQSHNYPSVGFLLVLSALQILTNRRHILQYVGNLHLDLHFKER
jgi:hypothetical protein